MGETVKIEINGVAKEYPKGISLLELSKQYQENYKEDIILAYVDNHLCELFKTVNKNCKLHFITTADTSGHKTYNRGLVCVMIKAIYRVLSEVKNKKVMVEYTIGNGLYCEIVMDQPITEELCSQIKSKMQEIIDSDLPFVKKCINTDDAIELFNHYHMYDKSKLFRYRRVSKTNIYSLGAFQDYYYGYMPPSTGMLKLFDIFKYKEGIILLLPEQKNPKVLQPFKPQENLFKTLKEANEWTKTMEVDTVGALNDIIVNGDINELILVQEALQEMKVGKMAQMIKEAGDKKFVMIAGPSSSGKTTFSHRLSIQLRTHGLIPHPIAVDDYFIDRDHTPLDEEGNPNFETLQAIDLETFNRDMTDLLNGKTVELPTYNFKTGHREYKGNFKTLGPNDILVIEGIHALNEKMSYSLPRENKFKIYISALTSLNIDEHNRIPTTDVRLIRRMVRDFRTRGASGRKTINMWPSVRRGEEENIFPFQEDVDVMFNSALIYELAILKMYAEPILFSIDKDCDEYMEAKRLLKFLDYFLGINSDAVPQNSILKEFVGGSCFKV